MPWPSGRRRKRICLSCSGEIFLVVLKVVDFKVVWMKCRIRTQTSSAAEESRRSNASMDFIVIFIMFCVSQHNIYLDRTTSKVNLQS
jgi:hypothetical protein